MHSSVRFLNFIRAVERARILYYNVSIQGGRTNAHNLRWNRALIDRQDELYVCKREKLCSSRSYVLSYNPHMNNSKGEAETVEPRVGSQHFMGPLGIRIASRGATLWWRRALSWCLSRSQHQNALFSVNEQTKKNLDAHIFLVVRGQIYIYIYILCAMTITSHKELIPY